MDWFGLVGLVWLGKVRFDSLGFVRLGKAVLRKADVSEKTIGFDSTYWNGHIWLKEY